MDLKEIRKENELVDLFCNLAEIPSPSLNNPHILSFICSFNMSEKSLNSILE